MHTNMAVRRVLGVTGALMIAPLAFSAKGLGENRLLPVVEFADACAETGACCFQLQSICPVGTPVEYVDHFYEASGNCN